MTREEMIERAQKMRSRDLFGAVSEEELATLPAIQTELQLDVGLDHPVHIYQLTPKGGVKKDCPMVINFHGGGFIKGRQDKDRVFCSNLAEQFGALIWDVDYRLAPEYPYPEAVNESYAVANYAFSYTQDLGVAPKHIILIGHSAGGNLAITVCMKASETNAFQPAALIAEYCPLDIATDPSTKPRAEGDMPAEVAKTYNAFYCDPETAKSPYVSPLFATDEQLKSFPNTMLLYAERDSLSFEDAEFAKKLSMAGVLVTSKCFKNELHGFTINRGGNWQEAVNLMTDFIAQHLK